MGRFRPALELALAQFLASAEWPERERFRRTLVQRGLDKLNLDELLRDMPRSSWPTRQIPPDRVVLSFQVLQELPGAADLLNVCVAVIQRAYALYCSEADGFAGTVVPGRRPTAFWLAWAAGDGAGGRALRRVAARDRFRAVRGEPQRSVVRERWT